LYGRLTAHDYEDEIARDPRVMHCAKKWKCGRTRPLRRNITRPRNATIGNAVQVFFRDGSQTDRVAVDFPIGHRKRRAEGMPVLMQKFESSVAGQFPAPRRSAIIALCVDRARLEAMRVDAFVAELLVS